MGGGTFPVSTKLDLSQEISGTNPLPSAHYPIPGVVYRGNSAHREGKKYKFEEVMPGHATTCTVTQIATSSTLQGNIHSEVLWPAHRVNRDCPRLKQYSQSHNRYKTCSQLHKSF